MTTYILAGGCDGDYPEFMTQLGRVIHSKAATPKILSCEFAVEDAQIKAKFLKHKVMFEERFGEFASFEMASKDAFVEQARSADVIYFHGGSTDLLMEAMKAYPGIKAEFEGKIIVGASAGANYLSSYGFSPSIDKARKGGGFVDAAVVVHYGSLGFENMTFNSRYWQQAVEAVREESGGKEVILLAEGTFAVIER